MQTIRVKDILNWINQWAPPETAEEYDNVGLLVGDSFQEVTKVITTLDITKDVVRQAVDFGAELIISHHPIIFKPMSQIKSNDVVYLLVKHGVSAICSHTNLDKAVGGVSDILAHSLKLKNIKPILENSCRIGMLKEEMSAKQFAMHISKCLGGSVEWNEKTPLIKKVGVCGGAGDDYIPDIEGEVDAYVTGEISHNYWIDSKICLFAAGHWHTEVAISNAIAVNLSKEFESLSVRVAGQQSPTNHIDAQQ